MNVTSRRIRDGVARGAITRTRAVRGNRSNKRKPYNWGERIGGDMADSVSSEDVVNAAILEYLKETYENPAIVTGWVVVAEFVDTEGTQDLAAFASNNMPYWKINGMLEAAPYEMNYADEEDLEDEDEDL
jgi:hypothetical protein